MKRTNKGTIRRTQQPKKQLHRTLYDVLLIMSFLAMQPYLIQGVSGSIIALKNHTFTNEDFGPIMTSLAYLYLLGRAIWHEYKYGTTSPKEYAEYQQEKATL